MNKRAFIIDFTRSGIRRLLNVFNRPDLRGKGLEVLGPSDKDVTNALGYTVFRKHLFVSAIQLLKIWGKSSNGVICYISAPKDNENSCSHL